MRGSEIHLPDIIPTIKLIGKVWISRSDTNYCSNYSRNIKSISPKPTLAVRSASVLMFKQRSSKYLGCESRWRCKNLPSLTSSLQTIIKSLILTRSSHRIIRYCRTFGAKTVAELIISRCSRVGMYCLAPGSGRANPRSFEGNPSSLDAPGNV